MGYRLSEEVYALDGIELEKVPEEELAGMGLGFDPYMNDPYTRLGATPESSALVKAWQLAGLIGGPVAAYHGYKRNKSIGWALVWGLFGGMAPPVTLAIALAQGFGKPKK